ncbi:MAG: sulfatase-like hydrolase/transferase, partial [Lentisphaerae bacterium]|nr:sulfatase-like hydrolase/transferase [Lentisphaerota bacterium]
MSCPEYRLWLLGERSRMSCLQGMGLRLSRSSSTGNSRSSDGMMSRISGVLVSFLLLLGALRAEAAKPNIVVILTDDLGWIDTGVYGSQYYETPNIDRLAERGMRFTNAYSASPYCSPTRAAIMTGQDPGRLHLTAPSCH